MGKNEEVSIHGGYRGGAFLRKSIISSHFG